MPAMRGSSTMGDLCVMGCFEPATICEFMNLERRQVGANADVRFMLRANMTVFQVEYVRKMQGKNERASIDFHGNIFCSVNRFSVDKRIETKHFRLCNFNLPLSSWLTLA